MSNITGTEAGGSFSSGEIEVHNQHQELLNHLSSIASTTTTTTTTNSNGSTNQQQPPLKKKRNLPGNPDPSAEVIALSPHTLLATNRFVCEICHKGFQRDQNLQLHRRGHNLPWKLRQRTSTEIKKKVYVCPEPSCVHHNPARALGDLTGIKKHFCRKHGEKKWKCDKCSKKYAVLSDWKAHSKTCGTKEYKCDCGTIFSRRDSFITHRAFCDALTEENNKANQGLMGNIGQNLQGQVVPVNLISMPVNNNQDQSSIISPNFSHLDAKIPLSLPHELMSLPPKPSSGNLFSSSSSSLQLSANNSSSTIFEGNNNNSCNNVIGGHLLLGGNSPSSSSASMSATALLQKAAQMGATTSSNNFASMAPSTFGDQVNQFFNANHDENSAANDDLCMFSEVLDQKNFALFKNIIIDHEQENGDNNNKSFFLGATSNNPSGLSRFSGDVMTVDFLGVGGSRKRNFHENQQQELEFSRGINNIGHPRIQGLELGHFEQQAAAAAALEKPMWNDV